MSYCRFLEADVYVYMHVGGWIECCGCRFSREESEFFGGFFRAYSTQQMTDHLRMHQREGDYVPERVFLRMEEDDSRNFPNARDGV